MTDRNVDGLEIKILRDEFIDMKNRKEQFMASHNNTPPKTIFLKPIHEGDYITWNKFLEMNTKWMTFYNANKRFPNFIWTNAPSPITPPKPPTPVTDWVLTGYFAADKQDTAYTCADSSMQMMLSAKGINANEAELAKWAGTVASVGTTHAGIRKAVGHFAPGISMTEHTLGEMGWQGIANALAKGCEFILHIRTSPLHYDANGNVVWIHDYGHYIFLVGVNINKKLVRVYDPTKGDRTFTFAQMQNAFAAVSQKSLLEFC